MTDSEICRSYLTARNPQKQIKILAQLTLESPERIKETLVRNGIDPALPCRAVKHYDTDNVIIGGGVTLPLYIKKGLNKHGSYKMFSKND